MLRLDSPLALALRRIRAERGLRRGWRELRRVGGVPPALPDDLRSRLLAIPADAPPAPTEASSWPVAARRRPPFLMRSPSLSLCASYVCMLVLTALVGNPYRIGVRTVQELQINASPFVDAGRGWIARLQQAGSGIEARLDDTLHTAGEKLGLPAGTEPPPAVDGNEAGGLHGSN